MGSFWVEGFLRLLSPPVCPGCDLALRPGEVGFCEACGPLLDRTPGAVQPPAASAAVFVYGGPLADAICRLKYGRRTEFGPILGKILGRESLAYAGRVDLVIPLPLHAGRLRTRGFNQAVFLARSVARTLGVPMDVTTLQRIRDTSEQAGLTRAERIDNVAGAFRARVRGRPGRALLVDDVRTTGATLASASEALLEAGFASVYTLALARAEP